MSPLPQPVRLVVPCYNESERLELSDYRAALEAWPGLSFTFVDDGSTDDTLELLRRFHADHRDRTHVVRLARNVGKGEAVRRGFLQSATSDASLLGYWDADLATPLEELEGMSRFMLQREADILLGSRVKLLGRDIRRKVFRHVLGRVFATLTSLILELPVYDTQCGSKLFVNEPSMLRAFEEPFESEWVFDVEILHRLTTLDANPHIVEYPLRTWHDVEGSKLGPEDAVMAGIDLLKIGVERHLGTS